MDLRWGHGLAALSIAALVAALAAGCGGLSTPEAEQRCDQEREADASQCIDDASYSECVVCYEDCGDDCTRVSGCPGKFSCPD